MNGHDVLHMVAVGFSLTIASYCLSLLWGEKTSPGETQIFRITGKPILTGILLITWLSFSSFVFWRDGRIVSALLIMALVSLIDYHYGRIPILMPGLAAVLLFFTAENANALITGIAGGGINLILLALLSLLGRFFLRKPRNYGTRPPLGFGDVYAATTLGLLLGIGYGLIGVLLAFSLAVMVALPMALCRREPIRLTYIRLGPYFFVAYVIMSLTLS